MKEFVYYTLVIVLLSLIITQPSCLKEFSITSLGKVLFLLTIVYFTMNYRLLAFLTLILFIMINQPSREGMSNKDFRTSNCKNNILTKNGKPVSKENIETEFPDIKFDNGVCNPCNTKCKFTITTSNEQITQEDSVKSKNSKDAFVIKESLRGSKHVEPFSSNIENLTEIDEH